MTGPTKIGYVGTNYTLSHNMSYLSTEVEYFHSVTCIVKPTKCLISAENFIVTELWNTKFEKVSNFYFPACPIFVGPVTFYVVH